MAYPIFPLSPMPAELQRVKNWNEDVIHYDSGDRQGFTNFIKPLYVYNMRIKAMNELKQAPLWAFVDTVKGQVRPFLMKDPYDFRVNSVLAVRSGITHAATLQLFDTNSFTIRADTTTIGSLFSTLSGFVSAGAEYHYSVDSNILFVDTKAVTDVWGVRSAQYWKKVAFDGPWKDNSTLWNIFTVDDIQIGEIP